MPTIEQAFKLFKTAKKIFDESKGSYQKLAKTQKALDPLAKKGKVDLYELQGAIVGTAFDKEVPKLRRLKARSARLAARFDMTDGLYTPDWSDASKAMFGGRAQRQRMAGDMRGTASIAQNRLARVQQKLAYAAHWENTAGSVLAQLKKLIPLTRAAYALTRQTSVGLVWWDLMTTVKPVVSSIHQNFRFFRKQCQKNATALTKKIEDCRKVEKSMAG